MAVNEHDKETDAADVRIAQLYREAAREEPPPQLGRVISTAARQPLGTAPPARRWWATWQLPFAVAAIGVVSVSLVALMLEEGGERLTDVPPAAAPPPAEVKADPAPDVAPPLPAGSTVKDKRREEARPASAPPAAQPAPRVETPASEPRQEAGAKLSGEALPERQARVSAAAPARAEGEGRASDAEETPAERSRAAEAVPPSPAPARAAPIEKREAEGPSADSRAPSAFPAPDAKSSPPAPRAKPAPKPAPAMSAKPEAPSRGFARDAAPSPRITPEVAFHVSQLETEPPSKWIERVLELRREGRHADAEGVLRELKKRFPGAVLPAELQ